MSKVFNEDVGLLKKGAIESFDIDKGIINVKLDAGSIRSTSIIVEVPIPSSLFYYNGLFIGAEPVIGGQVVVGLGGGGQYYFVSFLSQNVPNFPTIKKDELLIQSSQNTFIKLNKTSNIDIGSNNNRLHINTNENYISANFHNKFNFTQAGRRVEGIVKRDKDKYNGNYDDKLEDDRYNKEFLPIGFDRSATVNSNITGSSKNPPFVEQREMIYEFQYSSDVDNDLNESILYNGGGTNNQNYTLPNRRKSRADTLSLTLAAPNYLMEIVKGTVIDIFGNILDINRSPLPVGVDQNTIRAEKASDKSAAFLKIKEIERKSLAYHFEINARKDLSGQNGKINLPDINSKDANKDYARDRSRFFIDIDKEGQFKINVPASSETGNVPLLTRYENYSTFGPEDNSNPNKLIFRDDKLDIFHDSFAAPIATPVDDGFQYSVERGSITIKDGNADGAPIDRLTEAHIKHGTAYHDILQTCYAHQNNEVINYQKAPPEFDPAPVNINLIKELTDVVSKTINISGDNANAGGRSGSINFDGSIEMNIGANKVDRQSLWIDTAGGIVGNFGRDNKNRSAMLSMNGDVFIQVGGWGVSGDSRFVEGNEHYGAVLDLRIFNSGGRTHMLRFDDNGLTVMTPGNLAIHAQQNIKISAGANMSLEAKTLTIQNREVEINGGSI